MTRLERIAHFEQVLDQAAAAARQLENALDTYDSLKDDLKALEQYYIGLEWMEDYAADEAGLLPAGMKRGVLSQDGIDDLLNRIQELRVRMGAAGN
ncbi:MAG: DUF4298 domain-containing protein [Clostridia bacterium]|nr:DUF4298 domain-containing protein [Clostridia bacterium]